MNLTVRATSVDDADSVAPLMRDLGYEISAKILEARLDLYSNSDDCRALVAVIGSGPVGLISGHLIPAIHESGNIGRITALVVAEDYRTMGVGTALMRALEDWFAARGCLRCEVTSGEHRDVAHRFYLSRGYAPSTSRFLKILTNSSR